MYELSSLSMGIHTWVGSRVKMTWNAFSVSLFFTAYVFFFFWFSAHSSKLGKYTHKSVWATFSHAKQVQVDNFVCHFFSYVFFSSEMRGVVESNRNQKKIIEGFSIVWFRFFSTHHFHVNRRSTPAKPHKTNNDK